MGPIEPARRRSPPTVAASWQQQSWPIRILRAFLGVTFIYAGIQKLSNRHGAEFDPTRGAEVVSGPAPTPLARVPVAIDRTSGDVLAQS